MMRNDKIHKPDLEVLPLRTEHGEGPVWDSVNEKLYWIDILQGKFVEADIFNSEFKEFSVGQPVGALASSNDGDLLLALRDGFGKWNHHSEKIDWIKEVEYENKSTRFNDGAVDAAGRFFAGTTHFECNQPIGNLYSLDSSGLIKIHERNLICSNGMDWSIDNKFFYLIDTGRHVLYEYDFDLTTGKIENQRVKIKFEKNEFPDGMVIDSEDCFWIAMWGGAKVIRFDNDGKKITEIRFPVPDVTSCCFGGKDLDILIVTSSCLLLNDKERLENKDAGKTFLYPSKVKGKKQNVVIYDIK